MRTRKISIFVLALFMFLLIVTPALADGPRAGFGELFYDGEVVRTVVPPAKMTKPGLDNIYAFPGGDAAEGQRPVAAVGPGDEDYHGGKWALHTVSWNVDPYLLTSEAEVLAAMDAGDVTITRVEDGDFKCPIQP